MKHTVLGIVLGLVACTAPAAAQHASLGVKGGLTSATVTTNDATLSPTHATRFHLAASALVMLQDVFGVQIEAGYVQKGFRTSLSGVDSDLHAAYVEIPLLATARLPIAKESAVAPRIYAGPTIAFEASCTLSAEPAGVLVSFACDDPSIDLTRTKTDLGLRFGAGVDFPLEPLTITTDVAYDLGLSNLNNDPTTPETIRTRTWLLSVGIAFPLGTR